MCRLANRVMARFVHLEMISERVPVVILVSLVMILPPRLRPSVTVPS